MAQTVCPRCWEPLAPDDRTCPRCGTARPREPLLPPARKAELRRWAPRVAAVLAVAILAGGVVVLRPERPPATLPVGASAGPTAAADSTAVPATPDAAIHPVDAREASRATGGIECVVEDRPVRAQDCLRWAVRAPVGSPFTRLLADETVVVAAMGQELVAFDPAGGGVRWRLPAPPSSTARQPPALRLLDGRLIVLREGADELLAIDVATGRMAWNAPLDPRGAASLAVSTHEEGGPAVLVRHRQSVVVRRGDNGGGLLRLGLPGEAVPLMAAGNVIVAGGTTLTAIELAGGRAVWSADVDLTGVTVPPVRVGAAVVALTRHNELVAVDGATGGMRWRVTLPGVLRLLDVGDGRVVAITSHGMRAFDAHTGDVGPVLQAPGIHAAFPAGPGDVLTAAGSTLRRMSLDLAGETWTVRARRPRHDDNAALIQTGIERFAAAVLGAGDLLAVFDVPPPADLPPDPFGCTDLRPSEAMGGGPAWRGAFAHVAVQPPAGPQRLVMVGLPGPGEAEQFTLSARLRGRPEVRAEFARTDDDWHAEVTVRDGGRTSEGWPTHWAVLARFPAPGCWEMRLAVGARSDTVIVPVELGPE